MERKLHDSLTENKRLLTTEKGKMYGIYILDGFTGEVTELHDESIFDNWYDHCINPKHFKELAKRHNCEYTLETFYKVTKHYNRNYLNIDTLLQTSLDGKRVEICGDDESNYIFVETEGEASEIFKSLMELNEWLIKNELRPFPSFEVPADKENNWVSFNNKLFPRVDFKTFCKYSLDSAEFIVISIRLFDNILVNIDFQKYWNDFQLIDAMDTIYRVREIELDDIFDLTSLYVNEFSVNSRDIKIQIGKQTFERGNYTEFAIKSELIQAVKNEYGLDVTDAVEEFLKDVEVK